MAQDTKRLKRTQMHLFIEAQFEMQCPTCLAYPVAQFTSYIYMLTGKVYAITCHTQSHTVPLTLTRCITLAKSLELQLLF